MKFFAILLIFIPMAAFAQPADRDFTLTIPGPRVARVQAICEKQRRGMEDDEGEVPATLPLRKCMRVILFGELRQRNATFVRREAIRAKDNEINDFNTDMAN